MKVPRYTPSRLTKTLQRRILTVLLVAIAAMVLAFLSFPPARKSYYLSQLDDPRPANRLSALNVLTKLAVEDADLRDRVEKAFTDGFAQDDSQTAAVLVRLGSWAVDNIPTFKERFVSGLDTQNDAVFKGLAAVLREAGQWDESRLPRPQRWRWAAIRCELEDPHLRAAAVRELAEIGPQGEPHLLGVLLPNLKHPSPVVRVAAVEAISICLPRSRRQLLKEALDDLDETVRQEAAIRLELLNRAPMGSEPATQKPLKQLIQELRKGDYFARLQAIAQINRITDIGDADMAQVSDALKGVTQEALASGNGGLAGSALQALSHLSDPRYLPVMLDVAAGFGDQPMLRFMAARAASRLDAESGGQALINLFAQDSDVVRDLAAITASRLDHPAILLRLALEMFSPELDMRGPAALALALRNEPGLKIRDITLKELLTKRTTLLKDNIHAEPEWKPRGYYLCSRLILGDESVRDDLEIFELNEHFPRIAIYVALLHAGETSQLDLIFSEDSYSDQQRMALLRDMRFGEIVARYIPDAPRINWFDRPGDRQCQMDRLIKWWSIYRWHLAFDPQRRQYDLEES